MENFYLFCVVISGSLFLVQLLLGLIGLGHGVDAVDMDVHDLPTADVDIGTDADADGFDHGGLRFVGLLSLRAIVAAGTVFGLAGLAAGKQFDPFATFVIATAAGGAVLYAVAWMMRNVYRLASDGTVRIEHTVGQSGSVYLPIPERKTGIGKVTVEVQDRTMEYEAMTAGGALATGTPIIVTDVLNPEMVEVAAISATDAERETDEES